MKYFKITRTWSVKAEDEAEALRQIVADPTKYLESETVGTIQKVNRERLSPIVTLVLSPVIVPEKAVAYSPFE